MIFAFGGSNGAVEPELLQIDLGIQNVVLNSRLLEFHGEVLSKTETIAEKVRMMMLCDEVLNVASSVDFAKGVAHSACNYCGSFTSQCIIQC